MFGLNAVAEFEREGARKGTSADVPKTPCVIVGEEHTHVPRGLRASSAVSTPIISQENRPIRGLSEHRRNRC